jgi:hypothetical protein
MMADEMKSAIDLAMEKMKKMNGDEEAVSLTEEQKQKIAETRKEYEAKIAEKEIMVKDRLKELPEGAEPAEIQEYVSLMQKELAEERARLEEEKNKKIEKIRKQSG